MGYKFITLFSVLVLLLTIAGVGNSQLVTETRSIIVTLPEGEPQQDVAIDLQNDGNEAAQFRVRVIPHRLDLENRAIRDDRGGPDEMEYEWRDSNEEDGPAYQWIDIRELDGFRDLEVWGDDSLWGPFDLGFATNFYGHDYDEIYIGANGFATFLPSLLFPFINVWERLPNATGSETSAPPRALLAVNFQDLDLRDVGHLYYWSDENMAIVTWEDVPHFDLVGQATWTFQLIITAQGLMKYQYQTVGAYDNRPDMVIGFQNEDRDLGFTCAYNTADYLEEELAIAFGPPSVWVNWVAVEPEDAIVDAGGNVEMVLHFDAADVDPGYYYADLLIDVEGDQPNIIIPMLMSWSAPVGGIHGVITDLSSGQRVNNASTVLEEVGLVDEGSEFTWENIPVGLWDITVSSPDFNTVNLHGVEVVADEVTELAVELRYGSFLFDRREVNEQLAPDADIGIVLRATNDGNSPVSFTAERQLVGDANAEPWDLRREYNSGQMLNDERLQGVAFGDDMFFVAGAAGDATNQVYILNRDGERITEFDQVGESRYGMKDLAYDGQLIWGSGDPDIFSYNTDGELQNRFRGPFNPISNIAWDENRGVLWCSGTTTNIQAIDRQGNFVGQALNRRGLRIYGLAVFPEDPDGHTIYVLNNPSAELGSWIHKMNPDNGDTIRVRQIAQGGAPLAEAIEITNQYDIYSWVILTINNRPANAGGDLLSIIQLDTRTDWMSIDPVEGVIAGGEQQRFTLTLDASGLPDAEFEGQILFTHDGRGSSFVLPITLTVAEGPAVAVRQVQMVQGWNLISANLQPADGNVRVVTRALVNAGQLLMMKDGFGHFYHPERDFSNIPDWDVAQGYQFKVTEACVLEVEGVTVMADDPLQLSSGWQVISYYPRTPVAAPIALAGIRDHLVVAKDGYGNFFLPAYNFSNMGEMREGRGYQVRVDQDIELVYRLHEQIAEFADRDNCPPYRLTPGHFRTVAPTGCDMSLLVETDLPQGEIGIYSCDLLVGSGVIQNGLCGIAVRGDDPTTSQRDGALKGDQLSVRIWNGSGESEASLVLMTGDGFYETDGILVGRLTGVSLPTELTLTGIYPNPFNSTTNISFQLPEPTLVRIALYDQSGRFAMDVMNGSISAGGHKIGIDASQLPSGVYIVRISTPAQNLKAKLLLVR